MTDNKKQYAIITVNSYTKKDFLGNGKTYKKLDDIINHFYSNNTKDLLNNSGVTASYVINDKLDDIAWSIENDRWAVFPINSTTYLSDIIPYIKMGFKIVFMFHKDYKQFKKDYQDFMAL